MREDDFPEWETILAESAMGPDDLAPALQDYASFQVLIQDLNEEIEESQGKVGKLKAEIKALTQERAATTAAMSVPSLGQ